MHDNSPADALAETRTEIARLKKREAALRAANLERRGQVPPGRCHRVEVVARRARVFDISLLPVEVRYDPQFRHERVIRYVRCLPVQLRGSRPPGSPSTNTRPAAPGAGCSDRRAARV